MAGVDTYVVAYLLIHIDHGAGQGMDSGGVAPDRVGGERAVQHWLQIRSTHCLQLVVVWIAEGSVERHTETEREGERGGERGIMSAHPMLQILTMEVKRDERG